MAYHQFSDFRGGLDLTAPPYDQRAGTLRKAMNGHITRAGDFEKRKAFVSKYTLPAGTFGLTQKGGQLYVFGSAVAPVLPAGVTYVRCTVLGGYSMTKVYQAELFSGKIYLSALFSDGNVYHFYDGTQVTTWADGRARGSFKVWTGGGTITSIKVNGVEILGGTVTWTTSDTNTAALIANQINTYTSSPEYVAYNVNQIVWIEAPVGSAYNGALIATTCTGGMTVSPELEDNGLEGGDDNPLTPGTALRTLKNKMYSVSGPRLHYAEIGDPTQWQAPANGAGYTNLSNEIADAESLTGLAIYYRSLVIFAPNAYQIFDVFSDDTQNTLLQSTTGVGLLANRAAASYFNSEVFFLSGVGVRSLQARDASNYAVVSDPGARIDSLVNAQVAAQSAPSLAAAMMLVEPQENRLWVIIGDTVFVYSAFPSEQIGCWTQYKPTSSADQSSLSITDAAVIGQNLYVRAGDVVYLYGGDSGAVYDASVATMRIAFTPANMPQNFKSMGSLDAGVDGEWKITFFPEVADDTQGDLVADINGPTYDGPSIDVGGDTRYFALELVSSGAVYARVSSVGMNYTPTEKL